MADAQQPLLPGNGADVDGGGDARESSAAAAAVEARLEAGLSAEEGAVDFETLLREDPDHVIEYLANRGTKLLGTFITEDTEVLPLLRDGTIWTLGADSMDVDYQRMWRDYLQHDAYKAKGFSSKVEVEAHVVTIRNAALPDDRGILNPLVEKWQDGTLSTKAFGLPAVQAVITHKWDTWARRVLIWEFGLYLIWLLGFQAFIILFQDENLHLSIRQLAHTGRGLGTIVSLVVSLLGFAPFLYIEVCTLTEYGIGRWVNIWNLQDTLAFVLQIVIAVMYFTRWHVSSEFLSVAIASQVLLLYWRIQYWARAFQPLNNSFVDTLRAVIIDVRWFLILLLITLFGFAGAFYILFRADEGSMFESYWHAVLTLVGALFGIGGFDWDFFYKSSNPTVGIILLLGFVFTMSMVLLNCLIGLMSDAATKANDDDGTKYLCSKAQLIDELEASLPGWVRRPAWYPQFVHLLKVNPASAQQVEGSQLWALSTGNEGGPALQGVGDAADGGGSSSGDQEVKQQLTDLKAQVDRMEELLRHALANRAHES